MVFTNIKKITSFTKIIVKVGNRKNVKLVNKEAIWLYAELFLGHHDGSCHGLW